MTTKADPDEAPKYSWESSEKGLYSSPLPQIESPDDENLVEVVKKQSILILQLTKKLKEVIQEVNDLKLAKEESEKDVLTSTIKQTALEMKAATLQSTNAMAEFAKLRKDLEPILKADLSTFQARTHDAFLNYERRLAAVEQNTAKLGKSTYDIANDFIKYRQQIEQRTSLDDEMRKHNFSVDQRIAALEEYFKQLNQENERKFNVFKKEFDSIRTRLPVRTTLGSMLPTEQLNPEQLKKASVRSENPDNLTSNSNIEASNSELEALQAHVKAICRAYEEIDAFRKATISRISKIENSVAHLQSSQSQSPSYLGDGVLSEVKSKDYNNDSLLSLNLITTPKPNNSLEELVLQSSSSLEELPLQTNSSLEELVNPSHDSQLEALDLQPSSSLEELLHHSDTSHEISTLEKIDSSNDSIDSPLEKITPPPSNSPYPSLGQNSQSYNSLKSLAPPTGVTPSLSLQGEDLIKHLPQANDAPKEENLYDVYVGQKTKPDDSLLEIISKPQVQQSNSFVSPKQESNLLDLLDKPPVQPSNSFMRPRQALTFPQQDQIFGARQINSLIEIPQQTEQVPTSSLELLDAPKNIFDDDLLAPTKSSTSANAFEFLDKPSPSSIDLFPRQPVPIQQPECPANFRRQMTRRATINVTRVPSMKPRLEDLAPDANLDLLTNPSSNDLIPLTPRQSTDDLIPISANPSSFEMPKNEDLLPNNNVFEKALSGVKEPIIVPPSNKEILKIPPSNNFPLFEDPLLNPTKSSDANPVPKKSFSPDPFFQK